MSNLLLLATLVDGAYAQTTGCAPAAGRLVALPGPDEADVAPAVVPYIQFDDPCQVTLRIEVTADGDAFPSITDELLRATYTGVWNLRPNTGYTAVIHKTETEGELVRWTFTTGTREPVAIRSPSAVALQGWQEEVDGQLTQFVLPEFTIVQPDTRGVVELHSDDGRKLFAATHDDTARLVGDTPVSYPIGFGQSEFCVEFAEVDELGTRVERTVCERNGDNPFAVEEKGCSTTSAPWPSVSQLVMRRRGPLSAP